MPKAALVAEVEMETDQALALLVGLVLAVVLALVLVGPSVRML